MYSETSGHFDYLLRWSSNWGASGVHLVQLRDGEHGGNYGDVKEFDQQLGNEVAWKFGIGSCDERFVENVRSIRDLPTVEKRLCRMVAGRYPKSR